MYKSHHSFKAKICIKRVLLAAYVSVPFSSQDKKRNVTPTPVSQHPRTTIKAHQTLYIVSHIVQTVEDLTTAPR